MLRLLALQHRHFIPSPSVAISFRLFELHSTSVALARRRGRNAPLKATAQQGSSADSDDETVEKKSKGQKKREAHRAVDWGLQLSLLTVSQLRQAIRWGGLQEEVFDAVTLVQKIGRGGKNARRRQLNLIGGMLRGVDPDLMEAVIKATKDGDIEGFFTQSAKNVGHMEDGDCLNEQEADQEEHIKDRTERWLQGLVSGDPTVSEEIYSITCADFDRQELRRLVKDLQLSQDSIANVKEETLSDSTMASVGTVPEAVGTVGKARKALRLFLDNLAMKVSYG